MHIGKNDLENIFNTTTREFVIYLLLLIVFHFISYSLIWLFRKKIDFHTSEYEDAIVYRVSFWICTFSLATSIEAVLLLPMSVISNEILLIYPNSYYIKWLNSSLIQGLWNLVFLFSNLSLFILLPFAYFFTESQGFPGSHKGIRPRIYETFAVLALLGLLTLGMLCILSAIFGYTSSDLVLSYHLPFLYSCVSFLGVLMLLLFTPVGFARLFTVVGEVVVNRGLLQNLQHEYEVLQKAIYQKRKKERCHFSMKDKFIENTIIKCDDEDKVESNGNKELNFANGEDLYIWHSGDLEKIEKGLKENKLRRNVLYPIVMLFLLIYTSIAVLMVAKNTLALSFGIKTLPMYSQTFSLGITSLSSLGLLGAVMEIILILYLWWSSVVGFYTMPFVRSLRPKFRVTSMTHIIINCAVLLVLSSALPVLVRTLGITNFDLLGDFGRTYWLGNFYIVLFYNILFAVATAFCLGTKITATVRQELLSRFYMLTTRLLPRERKSRNLKSVS